MDVSIKDQADFLILQLQGNLIGSTDRDMISDVLEKTLSSDHRFCIVDISQVEYVNSSGMGTLITLLTRFRNRGGDLILVNPSDHVRKLLIMTKLQNIFNIAASEQEAIKKFKN